MKHITSLEEFNTDVLKSEIPVLIDFWAEWCGPCRMVGPVIDELEGDYDGKVTFIKINVDKATAISSKYNVFSIPTVAIFKNGIVAAQQVGSVSKDLYRRMIDSTV